MAIYVMGYLMVFCCANSKNKFYHDGAIAYNYKGIFDKIIEKNCISLIECIEKKLNIPETNKFYKIIDAVSFNVDKFAISLELILKLAEVILKYLENDGIDNSNLTKNNIIERVNRLTKAR